MVKVLTLVKLIASHDDQLNYVSVDHTGALIMASSLAYTPLGCAQAKHKKQ